MLIALLLASITRCALPAMCPTDRELIAAIQRRSEEQAATFAKLRSQDGGYVTFHIFGITALRDVHCDDASVTDEQLGCSFQVHYGRRIVYEVARLVRRGSEWSITSDLSISRDP
ncbi:MAG TPA: hypothetical protein VGC56_03730 [Allosphingosinicella sp.]|jgi:hypothetical protein